MLTENIQLLDFLFLIVKLLTIVNCSLSG